MTARNTAGWPARLALRVGLVALLLLGAVTAPAAAQEQEPPPVVGYRFDGGGWGHGVGMSQYGARNRALAGQAHGAILGHYYPGSAFGAAPLTGGLRVMIRRGPSQRIDVWGNLAIRSGSRLIAHVGWQPVVVQRSGASARVFVNGVDVCRGRCSAEIRFTRTWGSGFPIIDGVSYPDGELVMAPTPATHTSYLAVLSNLSLEDYVLGVAEVPFGWPTESLRAQAVAARTYAVRRTLDRRDPANGWTQPFDLYATTQDQVYAGAREWNEPTMVNWRNAVGATSGRVLLHGGEPIEALYSSSNGGHSAASDYVWSEARPYLIPRTDPFDAADNPNGSWQRSYTLTELGRWLDDHPDTNVGRVLSIGIAGPFGASGRINRAQVTVVGEARTITIRGDLFRARLNEAIGDEGHGRERMLLSTRVTMAPILGPPG